MKKYIQKNYSEVLVLNAGQTEDTYEYAVGEYAEFFLAFVFSMQVPDSGVSIRVRLSGAGARATIVGLAALQGESGVSIHTEQIHEAPDTMSNLLVKAAVFDQGSVSYDGIIRIEKKAQKSDAYQKNDNLLLSPYSHARSDPSLEILADDVRCTHGSTTGKPDEGQLWYLMSRGLSRPQATRLLVAGFFEAAIRTISGTMDQETVRKSLWEVL